MFKSKTECTALLSAPEGIARVPDTMFVPSLSDLQEMLRSGNR